MRTPKPVVPPVIAGRGVRKSDGRPLYAVASRTDPARWWLVVVEADGELQCDCPAGRHHRACAHRGLVAATRRLDFIAMRRASAMPARIPARTPVLTLEQPTMASATALMQRKPFGGVFK